MYTIVYKGSKITQAFTHMMWCKKYLEMIGTSFETKELVNLCQNLPKAMKLPVI